MDDGSILSVLIILLLLAFAACFALCETAFSSVSRVRIRTDCEHGDRRAVKAQYVLDNFDRAITTILIGTNIVHITVSAYVTAIITKRYGVSFVAIGTAVTTIAVFFVGEMLPKTIAKKYSERLSLALASMLCFFMKLFRPVAALLTAIGTAVASHTKGDPEVSVTEDELYDLIETMTDEGNLDSERGELVQAALDFSDVTVETVLTARVDLDALEINTPIEQILDFVRSAHHSRVPVYKDSVDNIVGILQLRKFARAYMENKSFSLKDLLDEPFYIHQSTHIDELLPMMSEKKTNIAIVSDNYGGTLGIVTVEDILEELVGEIWDEDDVVVEKLLKLSDNRFVFDADVTIEDAFSFMEYEDPDEFDFEHKQLGEWAYEHFENIPRKGESFEYHNIKVTISTVSKNRILKLTVDLLEAHEEEGDSEC